MIGERYSVLLLEEPWVVHERPEPCAEAMRSYYRSVRAANGQPATAAAASIWSDCQLESSTYGFSPGLYSGAVSAIATDRDTRVVGFVGHSFAAQRLAYLSDSLGGAFLQWAVLIRPFPVGVGLHQLIDARATLTEAAVGNPAPLHESVTVPGRSVPVSEFDYWSALAGLGYVSEADWPQALGAVVGGDDLSLVGGLSDQLWMRYGVDDLSPGMLAQWQEVCATDPDFVWHQESGVASALNALYAPCAHAEFEGENYLDWSKRICVTTSERDLVTPAELVRDAFARAQIVEVEERSHGSLQGLDECLARVGASVAG